MSLKIYHTVNAGLVLFDGNSGLLVDALHNGSDVGFSDSAAEFVSFVVKRKGIFSNNHCDLLYTHLHSDHYDPELTERIRHLDKDILVYKAGPDGSALSSLQLLENGEDFFVQRYHVRAFSSLHDGNVFRNVRHRIFIVESQGRRILILGDALPTDELADNILSYTGGETIDAAFINPLHLSNDERISFLKKIIIEHLFIYHIPYEKDDRFEIAKLAESLASRAFRQGFGRPVIAGHNSRVAAFT